MEKNVENGGGPDSAFWKNPDKIRALQAAFSNDATVVEACLSAKVSRSSYYEYKKYNPDTVEEWESLSLMNRLKAKANIVERIHGGDVELSKWYVERRTEEFIPTRKQQFADADGRNVKLQAVIVPVEYDLSELEKLKKEVHAGQAADPRPGHTPPHTIRRNDHQNLPQRPGTWPPAHQEKSQTREAGWK